MTRKKSASTNAGKSIEALTHKQAKRKNIPTAEYQAVMKPEEQASRLLRYPRNTDLDPQLVWRGKDYQDWSDLVVPAPPLYIQEKIHPKALIDDLLRHTQENAHEALQLDLFADFNGISEGADRTEFYRHDANWSNRMILGDSLQVMASLAEREGLRGKVQMVYIDPPYGIKFNSNFQWSTTSRDVKDGRPEYITREPEQVKAFRDTWRDGIHSSLTYLRDCLAVARDLLAESGSIFVRIGDENVHRVRCLMDEVFGEDNFVSQIIVTKTGSQTGALLGNIADLVLRYAKDTQTVKFRQLFTPREYQEEHDYSPDPIKSAGNSSGKEVIFEFEGSTFSSGLNDHWKTDLVGMERLKKADRVVRLQKSIRYKRFYQDYPAKSLYNSPYAPAIRIVC